MADDPYRFGFCAPSDFAEPEVPDGFSRAGCGHWVEDGDLCEICHPQARPRRPLTEAEEAELRRPYDPEVDPF